MGDTFGKSGGFVVTVQRDHKPVPVRLNGSVVPRHQALRDLEDARRSGAAMPRLWTAEEWAALNAPSCSVCKNATPSILNGESKCPRACATFSDCGGPF